jgi:flagellar motor protein MotB
MSTEGLIRVSKQEHQEIKQPVWLMSFADFAGILLASFVLLYSLAQTDRARMQAAFGIPATAEAEAGGDNGAAAKSMETKPSEEGRDTDYLATLLQTKIDAVPALDDIKVLPAFDKVTLDLPLPRIKTDGAPIDRETDLLFALAGLLAVTPNESAVLAELPESSDGAHWEKGMQLANALVGRLRDSGGPDTLVARSGISADGALHVRIVIFREAEDL